MSSTGPVSAIRAGLRRHWGLVAVAVVLAVAAALITLAVNGDSDDVAVTVALAAAAGLVIGLVAAWIVSSVGSSIRDTRDLAKLTGVPNLAVVARHPIGAARPDDVTMFRDPNSIEAEGYRTLRTSLEFVTRRPPPLQLSASTATAARRRSRC